MPLNWDATRCKPVAPLDGRDGVWRDILVFGTMTVGLHNITADNIDEWLWRARFLKRIGFSDLELHYAKKEEAPLNKRGRRPKVKPTAKTTIDTIPLSAAVLRRWIGLSTNASDYTRKKFVKNWTDWLERKCDEDVRWVLKEGNA